MLVRLLWALLIVVPVLMVVLPPIAIWYGVRAGVAAVEAEPAARARVRVWPVVVAAAGRGLAAVARAARRVSAVLAVAVRRVVRTGLGHDAGEVDEVDAELAAVRDLGTAGPDDDPTLRVGPWPPPAVVGRAGVSPAWPTTGPAPAVDEARHWDTAGINPWFAAKVAGAVDGSR